MKIKILVTGAESQLAKTIEELSLDHVNDLEFFFANKTILNITDSQAVESLYKEHRFDYCINCAAYTNVDLAESEQEKANAVNAEAVKNLAKTCNKYNTVLIHFSTDYVFDGQQTEPYLETDAPNPINVYGRSKLLGETYIAEETSAFFIIRVSWLYSKFGKNFVKTVVNKLLQDNTLNVITSQKGAPTSCHDLTKFVLYLITNNIKAYGMYHFSSSGQASWYDIAAEIAQILNKTTYVNPVETFKSIAERPAFSVLNNEKSEKLIGRSLNLWKDSIAVVVAELLNNNDFDN